MEGVNDDDVALNPWPHHNFSRRRFTVSHSPPIVVNPYCGCVTRSRSSRANLRWLWGCKCGEELTAKVMWRWARPSIGYPSDRNAVNLSYGDTAVVFYSQFSNGTAILRGTKLMREGIHFWEVKMISPVYGTDLMLGIGTPEVDLNMYRQAFRSALGLDDQSWGLSFRGKIQHKGEWRLYAPEFGQGSIVGILLDLWHGTLTFYLNKRPLNVAFTGLTPSKTGYYAMVSSTAARTGVRLIRAESHSVSLQYLSLMKIRKSVHDPSSILNVVTMPPGLQTFINNNLSYLIYPSPADMLPQQRSLIYGYTPSRMLHRPAVAEASPTNSSGNSGREQGHSSSSPDPEGTDRDDSGAATVFHDIVDDEDEEENDHEVGPLLPPGDDEVVGAFVEAGDRAIAAVAAAVESTPLQVLLDQSVTNSVNRQRVNGDLAASHPSLSAAEHNHHIPEVPPPDRQDDRLRTAAADAQNGPSSGHRALYRAAVGPSSRPGLKRRRRWSADAAKSALESNSSDDSDDEGAAGGSGEVKRSKRDSVTS